MYSITGAGATYSITGDGAVVTASCWHRHDQLCATSGGAQWPFASQRRASRAAETRVNGAPSVSEQLHDWRGHHGHPCRPLRSCAQRRRNKMTHLSKTFKASSIHLISLTFSLPQPRHLFQSDQPMSYFLFCTHPPSTTSFRMTLRCVSVRKSLVFLRSIT